MKRFEIYERQAIVDNLLSDKATDDEKKLLAHGLASIDGCFAIELYDYCTIGRLIGLFYDSVAIVNR